MRITFYLKRMATIGLGLLLVLFAACVVYFRTALYHRFYLFPRTAAAWEAIRRERSPVTLPEPVPWTHYRGAAHTHTALSHDSEISFEEILTVLHETDRDFIALSDHCLPGHAADFSAQWRGVYDGKLFIPGFEMRYGFMVWGLDDGVVLDCRTPPPALAEEIEALGGLLFIAHPERPRKWHLPQIRGMEIYNIHADFEQARLRALIPDLLLNFRSYPEQTVRLIFSRNTAVLAQWDRLNQTRRIVGVAANDAHQNIGLYGLYLGEDQVLVRNAAGRDQRTYQLNGFTRWWLERLTGPLAPGQEVFRIQLDPYDLMLRYVSTYALAEELSERAILDAFASGRVYIGFDLIADSKGFMFLARDGRRQVVMGEAIPLTPDTQLMAFSPHHCRFTLVHDGHAVGSRPERRSPGNPLRRAPTALKPSWMCWGNGRRGSMPTPSGLPPCLRSS